MPLLVLGFPPACRKQIFPPRFLWAWHLLRNCCASFLRQILFMKHDVATFPVQSSHLGHSIAFFVLLFWVLQVLSGFLLLGLVSFTLDLQFESLLRISTDGNFVWLLRAVHMLGANFAVMLLFVHFGKALSFSPVLNPQKAVLWLTGATIFLLSLGVAFSGYVLVAGNMSFWAALVILNLFTIFPVVGDELVQAILGGSTVSSWSIRRFSVLHFLLAVVSLGLVVVHLILLHRANPSKLASDQAVGDEFLLGVLVKDFSLALVLVLAITCNSSRGFIHADNWQNFSRISTPEHIEPEVYFLWTFSIIKLHNGKVVGFFRGKLTMWSPLGLGFATVAAVQLLDQFSAILLQFGISLIRQIPVSYVLVRD